MSLKVDPKGTYVPKCDRCFDEFGSYVCLLEIISEAAGQKVASDINRAMTPDFYQQIADAFGVTREEAFVRILDAFTNETPTGKRRKHLRAFIEYVRTGIRQQQAEGSTGGYLVPPEFASRFAAALWSARDTRTCGGCGRTYPVGPLGGQTPCPYCGRRFRQEDKRKTPVGILNSARLTGPPAPTSPECKRPPAGWRCTRMAGHPGPCAALPTRGSARPGRKTKAASHTPRPASGRRGTR